MIVLVVYALVGYLLSGVIRMHYYDRPVKWVTMCALWPVEVAILLKDAKPGHERGPNDP